jgi:hypothetical protein
MLESAVDKNSSLLLESLKRLHRFFCRFVGDERRTNESATNSDEERR